MTLVKPNIQENIPGYRHEKPKKRAKAQISKLKSRIFLNRLILPGLPQFVSRRRMESLQLDSQASHTKTNKNSSHKRAEQGWTRSTGQKVRPVASVKGMASFEAQFASGRPKNKFVARALPKGLTKIRRRGREKFNFRLKKGIPFPITSWHTC